MSSLSKIFLVGAVGASVLAFPEVGASSAEIICNGPSCWHSIAKYKRALGVPRGRVIIIPEWQLERNERYLLNEHEAVRYWAYGFYPFTDSRRN
jgi:hypothetical protein